eukprot:COSAG02_NODE_823_length_16754_cov_69.933353_4_plen_99_part_00
MRPAQATPSDTGNATTAAGLALLVRDAAGALPDWLVGGQGEELPFVRPLGPVARAVAQWAAGAGGVAACGSIAWTSTAAGAAGRHVEEHSELGARHGR